MGSCATGEVLDDDFTVVRQTLRTLDSGAVYDKLHAGHSQSIRSCSEIGRVAFGVALIKVCALSGAVDPADVPNRWTAESATSTPFAKPPLSTRPETLRNTRAKTHFARPKRHCLRFRRLVMLPRVALQARFRGERAAGRQDVAGRGAAPRGGRRVLPARLLDRGRLASCGTSEVRHLLMPEG